MTPNLEIQHDLGRMTRGLMVNSPAKDRLQVYAQSGGLCLDITGEDYDNQGIMELTQEEAVQLRDWLVEHVK